ncbi:hypothetical protein DFH05DRAFT_1458609 [Lentinula detonsa]|uniref:Transcription factor TFIIIC triple barrel domain-containing protein n=1 Tax=Lentinula detonsa TaxID=2804962 RepID=A0A9W8TZE7_9AGAR|nr:hypothetical protein DFH05DRAFT_1458609 [Lentinula detonsa]
MSYSTSTATNATTASFPASSSAGLCPGYKQVEEFGPDEEYEDEVEEFYVTLDLGAVEPTLIPSSSTYRLIGLDTPTPFMQLSGTVLQGRHESLLGTELLFTEAKDTEHPSRRRLSFTSIAEQRIRFKEVQLRPKVLPGDEQAQSIVIDMKTQEQQERLNNSNLITSSRMTGKDSGSAPRRRRKSKKNQDEESASASGSGRTTRRDSKKKDKGKAKEVLEEGRQGDSNHDTDASMDIDTGT